MIPKRLKVQAAYYEVITVFLCFFVKNKTFIQVIYYVVKIVLKRWQCGIYVNYKDTLQTLVSNTCQQIYFRP